LTTAYRFDLPTRTEKERGFLERLEELAQQSQTTNVERFMNAALWMPRQQLARLLGQWTVYQQTIGIHGSIVDCGVAFGAGSLGFANFVAIAEPYSHHKRVIAFDTFEGFPSMHEADARAQSGLAYAGGMAIPLDEEIARLAELHDTNRPIGHIPRVELIKGDACITIPKYVAENKHLLLSLLSLDFDLYEPTIVALREFLPLMVKGGIVMFDEANTKDWPGETVALRESGLLERGRLQHCPHTSTTSFMVLE
jgi:hypothetical protein